MTREWRVVLDGQSLREMRYSDATGHYGLFDSRVSYHPGSYPRCDKDFRCGTRAFRTSFRLLNQQKLSTNPLTQRLTSC